MARRAPFPPHHEVAESDRNDIFPAATCEHSDSGEAEALATPDLFLLLFLVRSAFLDEAKRMALTILPLLA